MESSFSTNGAHTIRGLYGKKDMTCTSHPPQKCTPHSGTTILWNGAIKKEQNIDTCNSLDESLGNYVSKKNNNSVPKGYKPYDSIYIVVARCSVVSDSL